MAAEAYELAASESATAADLQRASTLLQRAYDAVRRAQQSLARYVSTDPRAAALYVKLARASFVAQQAAARLQALVQRIQGAAQPAPAPAPAPA